MEFNAEEKKKIIEKFQLKKGDVGSPEVQVALLTHRIENLSKHFQTHKGDNSSKRGMLKLIAGRKNLLAFLKRESVDRYKNTINALGLRK